VKTPKDELVDILVDLPSLLEDIDIMYSCSCPIEKEKQLQRILELCWVFDKRVTQWYLSVPSHIKDNFPDSKQVSYITAKHLLNTHIMTLYWTLCLILYMTLHSIYPSHSSAPLPYHTDPKIYCRNIIISVPIFLHPSVGTFRWHLVNFPVAWAARYLNSDKGKEMVEERQMLAGHFERKEAGTMKRFVLRKLY
jgi:hypothetical protein